MHIEDMYNQGSRKFQKQFETQRLADRLAQVEARKRLTDEDQEFIKGASMFFLATADTEGHPICSYKGGMPGFVQILNAQTVGFPNYDGNGTFRSLGNIHLNPNVSMLFIDFAKGLRTIIEGTAFVSTEDSLLSRWPGAQLVITVQITRAFSSCPRYIHTFRLVEHSAYVPQEGQKAPVPDWKKKEVYQDVLPNEKDPPSFGE